MDKKQEIDILQSLKGDTYFAGFFGSNDIDQMCENIKNDFPIELNCAFYQKAEVLQKQVNEEKRKSYQRILNFVKGLVSDFEGVIASEVYDRILDAVGQMEIINIKREQGFRLTDSEIDWLIKKASSK